MAVTKQHVSALQVCVDSVSYTHPEALHRLRGVVSISDFQNLKCWL